MKKKTIATAAISMAAGAGLGLMFAPKKGEDLRKDLKSKISELTEKFIKAEISFDKALDIVKKKKIIYRKNKKYKYGRHQKKSSKITR